MIYVVSVQESCKSHYFCMPIYFLQLSKQYTSVESRERGIYATSSLQNKIMVCRTFPYRIEKKIESAGNEIRNITHTHLGWLIYRICNVVAVMLKCLIVLGLGQVVTFRRASRGREGRNEPLPSWRPYINLPSKLPKLPSKCHEKCQICPSNTSKMAQNGVFGTWFSKTFRGSTANAQNGPFWNIHPCPPK